MNAPEIPTGCESGDRCRTVGIGRAVYALVVIAPAEAAKANPPEFICRDCMASRAAGYARLGWGFHAIPLDTGEEQTMARELWRHPEQKRALDRVHRTYGPVALHRLTAEEAATAPGDVPEGTIVALALDGRIWVVEPDGTTHIDE